MAGSREMGSVIDGPVMQTRPGRRHSNSFGRYTPIVCSLMLVACVLGTTAFSISPAVVPVVRTSGGPPKAPHCPWATPALARLLTPTELAREVDSHMTRSEKFAMVILHVRDGYENSTAAIPRLCIPSLTLQDGPDGIAFTDTGVTQLPAAIGLAASFDPTLARVYGKVLGQEAKHQGIDVVQAPNLNIDRVANAGRTFEGFGEDPFLVSAMGVGEIDGIQSQGVMANAKHFTAYNQETDRRDLNEDVSTRALQEIYLPPFKAAVEQAHVASIMCAYGSINGVNACESPSLFHLLYKDWHFTGFVRSDLNSVTDSAAAFNAKLDLIKPATSRELSDEVANGVLSMAAINNAVLQVLTQMFAYHLITHPFHGRIGNRVTNSEHIAVALRVAERSMVLLKNQNNVLPLTGTSLGSVAVIGTDAASRAATAGIGGAYVVAPFVTTPIAALTGAIGTNAVSFAPGGSAIGPFAPIPSLDLLHGVDRFTGEGLRASAHQQRDLERPGVVGSGSFSPALFAALPSESTVLVPRHSGICTLSLTDGGNSWLYFDHHLLIRQPGLARRSTWSASVRVVAGHHYPLRLVYYAGPDTELPRIGMQYQSALIARAVAIARHAQTAVVFVSDPSSEGDDRPTLGLPGDQDELIDAVAAVNRHTIVVINSGGAVLMPWLSRVAGVLEAWYPGEDDGDATAAVLLGRVDPAGHLPITFPRTNAQSPTHVATSWPGLGGVVRYNEGLDVGYRYYQAHDRTPLFPFGFGLSYTSFALSSLKLTTTATTAASTASTTSSVTASVEVENTGTRTGTAVVQAYIDFPAAAGEPPNQLVAFGSVTLASRAIAVLHLHIPNSSFLAFLAGRWQAVAGNYLLSLGQSSTSLPLSVALQAPQFVIPSPNGTSSTAASAGAASAATPSTASTSTVAPTQP